jgi:hypothetical protein
MPYVHSKCFILKLHGDYIDTRLKNTDEELAHYAKPMRALLWRILDDHGLVVCGWSADYDRALVEAILASPNRRFALYWLQRGQSGSAATEIIEQRRAVVTEIESADRAFRDLLVATESIRELGRYRPQDTKSVGRNGKALPRQA